METREEKRIILSLSEEEAGILMNILGSIDGDTKSKLRLFADSAFDSLEKLGVHQVKVCDGSLHPATI